MHACVVMLQVSCPYYLATWLLWQDGSGSLLDRPDFAEPARGALEAMTPPAETPKCPDLSCSGMPAWVMFSTWKLTFIKKVCSCMDGCMHRFFLCNIFDQRCKLSGIHACTHAEVEGTAGENSISDCVSNMQPIPSAAPVLVDLGQEDRFGQSNQGQFLESVRHDIYSKKRQHLKSLTKNIYYIYVSGQVGAPQGRLEALWGVGGPNAACTLVRFSGSCVWVPECDLDKLRLYNGISRPLAVMSTENTKLIDMQAASVAAVPSKLPWQPLLNSFAYLWNIHELPQSLARESKDVLLARFIEVSKADCEMNLYLIRAKPGPQPSMLSMHVSFCKLM